MVNFASTRERDEKGRFIVPSLPSGFDKNAYFKNYYKKNKEKKIKVAVEWNRKNKHRRKIIKDKWRSKNKERTNFLTRRYINRRKNAIGTYSFEEIKDLFNKYPICYYCKLNKSTTIDHIIPLSKGGTNWINNLIPACVSCNSSKGNKIIS